MSKLDLVRAFGHTLAETESLPAKQLLEYQQGLLQRLLLHARNTTPFYRTRLDFDCDTIDIIERTWNTIPILTRIEAGANRDALMSRAVPPDSGRILREETSGSTGIPFEYLKSELTDVATQALTERMFRWWSIDGSKCLAHIYHDKDQTAPAPDGRTTVFWHSGHPSGRKHSLDAAASTDVQLDWLRERRPDYLATFSTNLNRLALRSMERKLDLRFELLLSFGTRVDPDIRITCRDAFGAEIADSYGSQEVGHVATQCPDCGHYHLAAEISRIEILGEDGQAAAPGQSGRIVVTALYNYAMPLIRYDMGDFAEAGVEIPTCGRGLPTLRRILGRARNRFRFRDGSVIWPELTDFRLREFVSYTDAQLLQTGVPPVVSGITVLLRYAKVGLPVQRWFAQNKLPEVPDTAESRRFTRDVLDAARSLGWPLPEPEYMHQDDAVVIARWLADCRAAGQPAQLDTNPSSGVRVCLAALDHGLDISGASSGWEVSPTLRRRPPSFNGPAAALPAITPRRRPAALASPAQRPSISNRQVRVPAACRSQRSRR